VANADFARQHRAVSGIGVDGASVGSLHPLRNYQLSQSSISSAVTVRPGWQPLQHGLRHVDPHRVVIRVVLKVGVCHRYPMIISHGEMQN
jgi:hypothetical protein